MNLNWLKIFIRKLFKIIGFDIHRSGYCKATHTDDSVALIQLQEALRQASGFPLPPKHLQIRVTGRYPPDFIQHGIELSDDLEKILPCKLSSFQRILDFGCGCGRVLRELYFRAVMAQELYGSDIDAEAIKWCQQNYAKIAKFSVNPYEPPTTYPDSYFDLVYAISVFTHLPEDLQDEWLAELRRIVKPGGLLILSFHGDHALTFWPREHQKDADFIYADHGPTNGLPEFYRMTYHSHRYIREHWSKYLEILEIRERAIHDFQDSALCRVPND